MKLGHEQAKEIGRIIARFQQGELNIQETALLSQVQFDQAMVIALKEGARRAAENVVNNNQPVFDLPTRLDTRLALSRAILAAAEQWTEKEL